MESRARTLTEIVVATGNSGKVAEIVQALAGLPVKVLSLTDYGDIPAAEETGSTFAQNAEQKARHYARYTGKPCLADDSGLEVDALGGAPGVYSARYAGADANAAANNHKLLTELCSVPDHARTARFRCVLAFVDGEGAAVFTEGACEGLILLQARGLGGFGYDPLFYVPEYGKTMAEMTLEEKNAISHRGQALTKMTQELTARWA